MSFDLHNKKVLITGSSDGLGLKLASNIAEKGANVIIHGKDQAKIDKVVNDLTVNNPNQQFSGIMCDFNFPESITAAFNSIQQLDILINNAGVWLEGDTIESTPEQIINLLHVNLGAPMLVTRALLPILKKAQFGQILNVSSVAGVEIPSDYFHTIYSATKFGIQAFSEAMAKEFDNTNLRVMGYYPGGMATELFHKAGIDYKKHEPWMFDPQESVEAIIFMLTRDPKVNVKRMDLINHLQK